MLFLILYLLFIWTYPGSGSRVFCGTCYEKQPCGVAFTNRAHVIWKLETWGLHMHKFPSVPVPMFCSFYTRDYFTHSLKTTQFLLFISRFILTHGTMNTLGATENDVHLLQLLNTSSLQSWSSVTVYTCCLVIESISVVGFVVYRWICSGQCLNVGVRCYPVITPWEDELVCQGWCTLTACWYVCKHRTH